MNDAKHVTTGKPKIGGAIHRAPLGTTLPTDAVTALDAAFLNLGYVGDEGLKNNNSSESSETKAWGGDIVMDSQTSKQDIFNFALIEATNVEVLKTVYGPENVTGDLTSGIHVRANSSDQKYYSWVFEMIMNDNVLKRIVVPSAKITSVGEITYADNQPVGYNTTISATPDNGGDTHHEYLIKKHLDD